MKIINYFRNLPNGVKIILTINIVIYVLCLLLDTISYSLISKLAVYATNNPNFRIYQFITSQFTHTLFFDHIFFNMLFFIIFAVSVENKLGTRNMILLYLISGVIGSVFCDFILRENYLNIMLKYQNIKPQTYIEFVSYKINLEADLIDNRSYGASGSVCGIMSTYVIFNILNWKKILINILATFFFYQILTDLSNEIIHFGGVVGGIIVTILIIVKNKNRVKLSLTPNFLSSTN